MTIRKSQAFAAHRHAITMSLMAQLTNEIAPAFNAESEDIRRQHEEQRLDPKQGEALADHFKRARIQDMVIRRNEFISSLQTSWKEQLNERIKEYEGEIKEVEENGKKVMRVYFPDKSSAKVPPVLWIDYKVFQRV